MNPILDGRPWSGRAPMMSHVNTKRSIPMTVQTEICEGRRMTVEQGLRAVAGAFVMISVAFGVWVNPWFLAFTAFVGANLFQSAFSKWCPMMWILKKLGFREARS
jgi:hypothetical protein